MFKKVIQLFAITALLIGCTETKENLKQEFMQSARGEVDEIILVMDSLQYSGALGDAIKAVFREPIKGLPQDEPIFSVNKASPKRLNNVLKSASNMIFVMSLDSKSRESASLRGYFTAESLKAIQQDTAQFFTIRRDEFAKGQVVLYLFSNSEELLAEQILNRKGQLQELFESTARRRIQKSVFAQREKTLEKVVAEDQPFTISIPYGWEQAKNAKNFYWLRFLEADKEQNIFVYYEPYTDPDVFKNIPQLRDRITERFLRDSEQKDLYITRQERPDIQAVFSENVNFDGKYAVKTRGLWKYSDISGGGPYISYTVVDEASQMLFYIEGFVYSPGTTKKNYIRELDAIISTLKVPSKNQ